MPALIVDDLRFVREYLVSLLEGHGLECNSAENGQVGLHYLGDSGAYDVALVHWNTPVMGGLDMVKAVRGNPARNRVKILMVTTEAESTYIEAALEAGADEYLMKPFDEDGLIQKLQMIGAMPS